MPAVDASPGHRFIGTFGRPCTVTAKRQAGPAATFRFPGLQAGDGWRRFACSAVTPTIDFTGRFSINGQQRTNFNTAEYFRLAYLPLPAQGNQPGRLHQSSLLRMHAWMGGPCACPLAEMLARAARAGTGSRAARMRRSLRRKAAG